jgi:hypothetical protein
MGEETQYLLSHDEWGDASLKGNGGKRATCETLILQSLYTPRKNKDLQGRGLESPRFYTRHPRTSLKGKGGKGCAI